MTLRIIEMNGYFNFIKSDSCRLAIVLSDFHGRNGKRLFWIEAKGNHAGYKQELTLTVS